MHLLVLGSILCALYFYGQYVKNAVIPAKAVLAAFAVAALLCAVARMQMPETDLPSLLGCWFIFGTTFYALWRRFFKSGKKNTKKKKL